VKIKVVHHACGREIFVQQILESEGHCPWDGKALSGDYTASLAEALEQAERAGTSLEGALDKAAGMNADIAIERKSLLGPLEEQLDRFGKRQMVMHR
jgi:hypothetical protein